MASRLRFALLAALAALVLSVSACGDSSAPTADTSVDGGKVDATDSATDTPNADITVDTSSTDSTVDSTQPDMPGDAADAAPDSAVDSAPDVGPDLPPPDTSVDTATADAFVTATNQTCTSARVLTLTNGFVSAVGSTTGAAKEFTLSCRKYGNSTNTTISGPSAYYKFTPVQNKWYRIRLVSSFSTAYLAVFTNPSCAETDIETDCQSQGGTGTFSDSILHDTTGTVYYRAGAPTDVFVLVQGSSSSSSGDFRLEIEEFTPPTNGTCANAQTITLTNGVGVASGDTSPDFTPDEFSTLGCNTFGSTSGSTTNLDGPQAYYKFAATQGDLYRVTISSTGHSVYAYLFRNSTCTQTTIEADCQSSGSVDGGRTSSFTSDESFFYRAPASGDIYIAVDSIYAYEYGEHTVRVEKIANPPAATCAAATTVTLNNGSATINGFTDRGATPDEFSGLTCKVAGSTSNTSTLDGPQTYYKFAATQGQWYKLTLSPTFTAYMYAFTSNACTEAAISSDCSSAGATGLANGSVSSGHTEAIYFQAPTSGDVYIGVDSTYTTYDGDFVLKIDSVTAPTNGTCGNAQSLTFTNGKAEVTGWMGPLTTPNDFTGGTDCGTSAQDGPQAYFQFNAQANAAYIVKVESVVTTGSIYAYAFGANCGQTNIEADCSSNGAAGQITSSISTTAGDSETMYLPPGAAGVRHIAVDSTSNLYFGEFKITVQEYTTPPANQTCAAAQAITLTNNAATVNGTTVAAVNEYGTSVSCGGTNAFAAGQAYYSLQVQAGVEYTVKLAPTYDAELYLFTGACSGTNINTSCSGTGQHASVSANGNGALSFTPSAAGTLYIAVDGVGPLDHGNFQLDVSAFIVPTLTAPFTLDFESSNGGLAATGDWQWGQLNFQATSQCSSGAKGPTNNQGPTGGSGMWGTVLNDCYNNLGNNEGTCSSGSSTPANDSRLVFNVTIPSTWTTATLTWAEWFDVFTTYDFGDVRINGTSVKSLCSQDASWQTQTIDMSSYIGQTVQVSFNMVASTVVAYAGWYIDSMSLTGN